MTSEIKKFFSKLRPPRFSTGAEKKIYQSLVDDSFYKSLLSIWTSMGVGFLVYTGLLFYPHDWQIHLWILLFYALYLSRLLAYYFFFKSDFLSNDFKRKRYSSFQIVLWGTLSGLIWVYLLFIVKDYSFESQIFSIFPLVLFALGVQSRYSLLPLWYVSYLMIIVIPLCTWLFFQGSGFVLWGFGILLFSFYTIVVVYSYFQIHFDAIFFHIQNKKLLSHLAVSNKKLSKINDELQLEIKRRHQVEKKLKKSASHDDLTGLPNRLLLEDRLNQSIMSSRRKNDFFAVLFIDLDGFKRINDTFGHEMGDKILKAVAVRLKKTLRAEDTVSRIGGDEFVVIITHLEQENDVSPIAQKLIASLSNSYIVEKHAFICTASIGVAMFPSGGTIFRDLIKNADEAMYDAKRAGGARVFFYSPPNS